jgi:hypothetical protein
VTRQMRKECSLRQGDKRKNASVTRLFSIFRNALTLQGARTFTAIQRQIARENFVRANLEADKAEQKCS